LIGNTLDTDEWSKLTDDEQQTTDASDIWWDILRFVDPQGNAYQLIDLTQAERIDALPEALVVRVAE
jgi:hypothetical protein